MFKRFFLALALFAGLLAPAYPAGTINLSLTQQLDNTSHLPLANGKLYFFAAGTTTPQIAYQDTALTIPLPGGSIYTLDANGRIPQFFLADGQIKIRLDNSLGVTQLAADNLLVIGPSSGGGGGTTVDPTTVLATGDLKVSYGTGILTGFVRANGRNIGSATSGATERANSDVQALFLYLWGADANLAVSGGRGASAAADWAANKTIALPDWRGRALAGLDDMGNTAAGRLTATGFGAVGTTLGLAGGGETQTLTLGQLPGGITVNGSVSVSGTFPFNTPGVNAFLDTAVFSAGSTFFWRSLSNASAAQQTITSTNPSVTFTSNNTGGFAHPNVQPTMLATIYVKL